jgi:hypothetical protein
MAENDSNTIKPVESLQNIPVLAPAKRREQRKQRQQTHLENEEYSEQEENNLVDEHNLADEQELDTEITENESDRNTIDYCA